MAIDFEKDGMSREDMEKIAGFAPPEAPSTPSKKSKKSSPSFSLGKMDVAKYLDHYGIEYHPKRLESTGQGPASFFCLRHCLFDENHRGGEAAIVQYDSGSLAYFCYHDSCAAHTWAEARRLISKEESLAKFCEFYDPKRRLSRPEDREDTEEEVHEVGSGFLSTLAVATPIMSLDSSPVPPPSEIDPREFFLQKGKRRGFVPSRMASYLMLVLQNLVYSGGTYWRFREGVWSTFDRDELVQYITHALGENSNQSFIENSLKVLQGYAYKSEESWPEKMKHINCLNGMLNIETGKLEPHDPAAGYRIQLPVHYDWGAEAPLWMKTVEEIFAGEPEKVQMVQEFFGYCLLGDCRYEKALFLLGEGANGKGTLLHMLRQVIGPKNCSSLNLKDLSDPKFTTYYLQNKLVNIATETTSRDPLGTELFKTIVSGEPTTTEKKYGHKFDIMPFCKMILAMNDLPVITDKSHGFVRRLIVLRCTQRFEAERCDPLLKTKLEKDIDGVFMWMVLGLERLIQQGGFTEVSKIVRETMDFARAINPAREYFDQYYELDPLGQIETSEVYEHYKSWCEQQGQRKLASNRFTTQFLSAFPGVQKRKDGSTRRNCFYGVSRVAMPLG